MDMLWNGWGDPAKAAPLPDAVAGLLHDLLGVRPSPSTPVALNDLEMPEPTLSPAALKDLADAVGSAEHVRTDTESRVRHIRGKSTPDLLRIRAGDLTDVPQAVVLPASHEEVLAVLRACAAHAVAVVPYGGGTSVVGGLAPERGEFIALDLRRMDALLDLDPVSRTAVLQPGLRGPQAETLLAAHGFTLGHFPQSFEWATVGGVGAARARGPRGAGVGRGGRSVRRRAPPPPPGPPATGPAPRA
ncbi:FAD-binding oxidoreductase, partial [Streptomyces griseoluteus]|uniref:FAD-binding oxidoreductase n=1 Tax=Streptomyces griseoluteus TaxID=29306 RepID=UPI0036C2E536